jgi:tripartite-type tricarboxylate transporter receptor subunit TctC
MEPSRRALSVGLFGLAAGVAGLPVSVSAQAWPQRTVRFVVPFPAGSSPDVTARIIASKLTDSLGQTVIIENRTGAAGIIGADLVAKA